MENRASFDLNQALGRWRATLQNLGGFSGADLEELEGHLRESISALHAGGLAVEEAFVVGTRRLGSERQLAEEFAKANPRRTWTERALWMVAGVLAVHALSMVAAPFPNIFVNCIVRSGLDGHLIVALNRLAYWMVWGGGAAIAYWALNRQSMRRDRWVAACLRQPVLTGLGLFLGLEGLQFLMRYVMVLAGPVMDFFNKPQVAIDPQTIAILNSWFLWIGLFQDAAWIVAVPLLAGYAWRKRERLAAGAWPMASALEPAEDEAVQVLQGQGLSREEASLVLARRRGIQAAGSPSVALATERSIWLERAVWMVAGVALSQLLTDLIVQPAWILAVATGPSAPVYQHLGGFASVGLGLMLAAAIIAGLGRWVMRHPRQSAWVGRVCLRRPALAATALLVVCAGFGLGEYALFTCVVWPANSGLGAIGSQWMMYGGALTHVLIPVALLLWLARRWLGIGARPVPSR